MTDSGDHNQGDATQPNDAAIDNATPPPPAAPMDRWAAEHPWHPRIGPWFGYMILLTVIVLCQDYVLPPNVYDMLYGPLKVIQALAIGYLIWRWRRLVPEVNWHFHWLVIPISIFLTFGWVYLRWWMDDLRPPVADGQDVEPHQFETLFETSRALFWLGTIGHLLTMIIVVPMIEETFNRSLLLRSFHRAKETGIGFVQFLCDFPGVGDVLINTRLGMMATQRDPVFGKQFRETPLGELSAFGVIASTAVFALVHVPNDWPGSVLCGVTWCIMLRVTRHKGLGPIIWSHGMVNLLLWGYCIYLQMDGRPDWRFF